MSGPSPIFPPQLSNQISTGNALFLNLCSQLQNRISNNVLGEQRRTEALICQKPQHSYIGLIAKAILSTKDKRMLLSEVYEWILLEYPFFRCAHSCMSFYNPEILS